MILIVRLAIDINPLYITVSDPRTKDQFMNFGNPIPVWILTALYLYFVIYAGPKYMKNRQPYSLKYFMVIYNIGLVILSIYMFVEVRGCVVFFCFHET